MTWLDHSLRWRNGPLNRRMLICAMAGFSSGMPLYVLLQMVPAWLRSSHIDLTHIALFALAGMPYNFKFIWAPLLDRYAPSPLGRRRGWLLITQVLLLATIGATGLADPSRSLGVIAALTLATALFSATQDIAIDAYRRELLPDSELGLGSAVHVQAYRLAGLVPGSLALILADHLPWASVFWVVAAFMLIGIVLTLIVSEPIIQEGAPNTLHEAVIEPFRELVARLGGHQTALLLAFLVLYKLGDTMATTLATPFYIDMGFSLTQIGVVAKHAALWPAVFGGLLGGIWMLRIGINRALWIFGAIQMLSILGFALFSRSSPNLWFLAATIALEYFGVGLGTAAFVAFIARTTNRRYAATQFALFTALAALPRTLVSAGTGALVETVGWTNFFLVCSIAALPGMFLLIKVAPWNPGTTVSKPLNQ